MMARWKFLSSSYEVLAGEVDKKGRQRSRREGLSE